MASATQLDLSRDFLSLVSDEAGQPSSKPLYTPLDNARNEIRVLQISSCCKRDRSLKLFKCSLDQWRGQYFALSYVWGDPYDTRPVRVNNQDVKVTRNLADALHQLQEDGVVQFLWVDALCIDQRDEEEEKAEQVQIMGEIFSAAVQVVGWLGTGGEADRAAIRNSIAVASVARSLHIRSVHHPDGNAMTSQEHWRLIEATFQALCTQLKPFEGTIGSILLFLRKPYWKRLWIIQEITLATSAVLLCGSDHLSIDDLAAASGAIDWLSEMVGNPLSKEDTVLLTKLFHPVQPRFQQLPAVLWLCTASRDLSLQGILHNTCHDQDLHCVIPHDRIYAFLGLMATEARLRIKVDYEVPHTALFMQTTIYLLEQCGPSILIYCGMDYRHNSLPTWVVDWTNTKHRAQGLLSNSLLPLKQYQVRCIRQDRIAVSATVVGRVAHSISYSGGPHDLSRVVDEVARLAMATHTSELPMTLKEARWSAIRVVLYLPSEYQTTVGIVEALLYGLEGTDSHVRDDDEGTETEVLQLVPPKSTRQNQQGPSDLEQLLWNDSHRNLFVTEHGSIGSGPPATQVGDTVCALPECPYPFLIRPAQCNDENANWILVGPTWVDGMIVYEPDKTPYRYTMREFWETERKMEEIILS